MGCGFSGRPRAIPPEGGGGEVGGRAGTTRSVSVATASGRLRNGSGDEHDLADVAPLGEDPVSVAGAVERHRLVDDRATVPSSISAVIGSIHGASVPRSFHSVSMFSPMTALDSCIWLMRLKREHRQRLRQHLQHVLLLALADARGAVADQPPAGPQHAHAALERRAADGVEDDVERRDRRPPAVARVVERVLRRPARGSRRACPARPCPRPRRRSAARSAWPRCRRRRRPRGSARARPRAGCRSRAAPPRRWRSSRGSRRPARSSARPAAGSRRPAGTTTSSA